MRREVNIPGWSAGIPMEVWIARMNITVRIACGAADDWPQFDVAIFFFVCVE